jgi:hypothetical protein
VRTFTQSPPEEEITTMQARKTHAKRSGRPHKRRRPPPIVRRKYRSYLRDYFLNFLADDDELARAPFDVVLAWFRRVHSEPAPNRPVVPCLNGDGELVFLFMSQCGVARYMTWEEYGGVAARPRHSDRTFTPCHRPTKAEAAVLAAAQELIQCYDEERCIMILPYRSG